MREKRGLNYGDYAYIEYFPLGMYLMEPPPNVARSQQIFQIWIRPVEPPTAKFALRLALYRTGQADQGRHPAGRLRAHARVPDQVRQRPDADQERRAGLCDRQHLVRRCRITTR